MAVQSQAVTGCASNYSRCVCAAQGCDTHSTRPITPSPVPVRIPCLSRSLSTTRGGKWWVKDRPLETISVKRVAGPPVSVGQPRAATAVRFFRLPSDAFWTKSAPHVEVGRALQRIECFLWRHGRLVHDIMSMLRDQAARRRMELNPITTQLNVIQQQQAHHTPISAVSANSLSAQFGHHPVAAYTPLSAVREYNPQQWAPSPGGVADHGHGQPQFASGRPRDLEGRIMAPKLPVHDVQFNHNVTNKTQS